ncbi:polysaccharide lyase [Aliiglaciecola sp. LCG003]|uniref:polysaccharide lyase n=1 Tax=Aliiglaciecola sp. LCG003 TaxID=3053655 RepID=UPI002572A490|nr:hypothetical protein [Aliiglaciecola sp. LCG003]WJG08472.1 hypothetical protein QR722_14145 [Aliiglaciecola sp. LCG003]
MKLSSLNHLSIAACVLGFCSTASAYFDTSATFQFASAEAHIFWPDGNFKQFSTANAKYLTSLPVADQDIKRAITTSLEQLKAADTIVLMISAESTNKGVTDFFSIEKGGYDAPQLIFNVAGKKRLLIAETDTYIAKKDRKPNGAKKMLKGGNGNFILLKFSLPEDLKGKKLDNPSLLLTTTDRQYGKSALAISQLNYIPPAANIDSNGIAHKYILDSGIEKDKHVYFADNFDQQSWFNEIKVKVGLNEPVWQNTGELKYVDHSQVHHYSRQAGKSVVLPFRTSRNLAGNLDFYFKAQLGHEPEEAYFRYYSMLAPGSNVSGGGKLPGFGGTYNQAGWGGRANNGENGWSARGAFYQSISSSNQDWAARMPIGSYIYEVDTKNKYGKSIPWGDELSTLQPGKWYSIEQYLKLNTPGEEDGILTVWIDGIKIFHRNNLNFRTTDNLKIEKIWMNYYFGGVAKPSKNFDMYLDNVVIASSYIGPIRR